MADVLRDIIRRNRAGQNVAIPSVCSAHPDVLRASLMLARDLGRPVVIEATSNQVNQDGGYTGQRPREFIASVGAMAQAVALPEGQVIFGGDHLGPQVWRKGPASDAMAKAREMVAEYAAAGFTKIHLDCSEGCAGEPAQLGDAVAAARAADLAKVALRAAPDQAGLLFVIGTEVPPPGGARRDEAGEIAATTPASARATLTAHAQAFDDAGLGGAWDRVGGLVVQPGVEFSPMAVHPLPMQRDPGLSAVLQDWPGICLEAHSTDYQARHVFGRLAELGVAFLKVGPALTFAYRRAMYALDALAMQAGWHDGPPVAQVMERLMLADPGAWASHYHDGAGDLRIARHFGLADRIRYYWPHPEAAAAVGNLLAQLDGRDFPGPFVGQAFTQAVIDRAGTSGRITAETLVVAEIQMALAPYFLDGSRPDVRVGR